MMLALKVLAARCGIGAANVDPEDVATLKSCLGDLVEGLADDQIACLVMEQELKNLRASRSANA